MPVTPRGNSTCWANTSSRCGATSPSIEMELVATEDRLDRHQDELSVVSGLAMRATGKHVAWASVHAQLGKLASRIEALERRE